MNHHLRNLSRRFYPLLAAVTLGLFAQSVFGQATLDDIYAVTKLINEDAKTSHAKVEELDSDTNDLYNEYKSTLKVIEGLLVYNRQLERQIANQEDKISKLNTSIDQVSLIQRQIVPLMLRMIDGLEQFVELDMPFLHEERFGRINRLRDVMEREDVSVSEKFSQVLRAFQIEAEFGTTIEAWTASISVEGSERNVDILKVGRVAMVYQTPDGEETGWFNKASKQWEALDDSYSLPVKNGLKIAKKQLTTALFNVPVIAPE